MPIKIRDGGAWKLVSDAAGGGEFFSGTTKVARIWDQKPTSDGAGSPDAYEAWRTRTLNTKEDPSSFVTLESGNVAFSLLFATFAFFFRYFLLLFRYALLLFVTFSVTFLLLFR